MFGDRHNFGFTKKMVNLGTGVAASGDTQRTILDLLQLFDLGRGSVRGPDGGSVVEFRLDVGLVGLHQRLLWATPPSSGDGTEDAQFATTGGNDVVNVLAEAKVSVKGDAEDARVFIQWHELIRDENLWMSVRLVGAIRG